MTTPKMIECPICKGNGIQEEKLKGFRRYPCFLCDGSKEIISQTWLNERIQEEDEKK